MDTLQIYDILFSI